MKVYILGAYVKFKCMAQDCPATCCSGWKIVVDREAYTRFKKIKNTELKKDILSNIVNTNGTLSFKNMVNGKCAMLDEDGLCRIQRKSDEKTLCNTCRKYPRLSYKNGENMVLSMAASCPVVINYLCQEKENGIWYEMAQDKKIYYVPTQNIEGYAEEIKKFNIIFDEIEKRFFLKADTLCELFFCFADIAVDLVIKCSDCIYLDGSFDIYEEEMDEILFQKKYDEFISSYNKEMDIFEKNYIEYRILTGKYEKSNKDLLERLYQIAGEILMNKVIMLSLSSSEDKNFKSNLIKSVHWIYKTAVHGKKSGSIMHKKIMRILAK